MNRIAAMWRNWRRRSRVERELDTEVGSYLEAVADEKEAGGLTRSEARRQAAIELGGREQIKEAVREVRAGFLLEQVAQDVRYAVRTLAARPTFTAVAVLSLALGIGANTAIFSLWNGVLHASLPGVHKPEQLVMLTNPDRSGSWTGLWNGRTDGPRAWVTYSEFEQIRDHATSLSEVMASQSSLNDWQVRVEGGAWEKVRGRLVSGGFFQVLRVTPEIGQVFTTADDREERTHAVISHNYWQRRFGARPDVLGTTFTLRKAAFTIIGVTPAGFIGETIGQEPDLWLPLRVQRSVMPGDRLHDKPPTKSMWLHLFGRLKPGVTNAQAEAQANAVFQAGLESFYGDAKGQRRSEFLDQRLQLWPAARGASPTRSSFSESLTALLIAVGVLLLIACANLANLLLARGAARTPEIALRLSLGASRGRLLRQLATESAVLAAVGGAAAMAVAYALHGVFVGMMVKSSSSFSMSFALDPLVLAFTGALTLAAALIFGAFPAWQVTKIDAGVSLKQQSRGTVGAFGQIRTRRVLVSLQLALSLPLLVGAGLLARTLYNLQRADLGFRADRLLLVRVDLREGYTPERRASLLHELLGEVRRLPGVSAASFSQLGLFTGGESAETIEVEGHTAKGEHERGSATEELGPGYFSALGIPILQGRELLETDRADGPKVCVINEAFAKKFFERRNPVGMHITQLADDGERVVYQVVGVVKDARTKNLRREIVPRYFVSAEQPPSTAATPTFLIRRGAEAAPMMEAVRQAIQRVDPALSILSARSIEEQFAPMTAEDGVIAQLAVIFGCVALAMAAIGLYGVLSFGMACRSSEIAIRIALGAVPRRVIRMVLTEAAGLIGIGLALGGGLAYGASKLIESRLYGVAPQDPVTLALASGLLLVVAFVAVYLPARRAALIDPVVALRLE